MLSGDLPTLEAVLAQCRWGIEQDFGYLWALPGEADSRFSLHLRSDPVDDTVPGILFARERGGARGLVVHGSVDAVTVAALVAIAVDDAGLGHLEDLQRLLLATRRLEGARAGLA